MNTALVEIHSSRARFRGTAGVNEALHSARQEPAGDGAKE